MILFVKRETYADKGGDLLLNGKQRNRKKIRPFGCQKKIMQIPIKPGLNRLKVQQIMQIPVKPGLNRLKAGFATATN